jgi:hypothetical protein
LVRNFCVTWTQSHKASVEARSKEDAKLFALHMPDRDSFEGVHNVSIVEVRR